MEEQEEKIKALEAELERIRKVNISFVKKVAYLRGMQKQYFKTRDKGLLKQCTALEIGVDNYLARCMVAIERMEHTDLGQAVDELKDKIDGVEC